MENYTSTSYDGITDYSSIFPVGRLPISDTNNIAGDCNRFLDREPFDDLTDCRSWFLSQLRITEKEAEVLREENINLQMTNAELKRRLNLMSQASLGNYYFRPPLSAGALPPLSSVTDDFRRMMIGEKAAASGRRAWNEENVAPIKVVNDPVDDDRVKLPKSISVRSSGYLKTVQGGGTSEGQIRVPNRVKTATEAQRVYVRGGKKENQQLELDVFNQGMTKTELCNKWQQTGACPYGEHCQFAHGIGELRPVLRHPRYKTEVCRMILAGDHCPYGHRCHFRHSLTEDEKLMAQHFNLPEMGCHSELQFGRSSNRLCLFSSNYSTNSSMVGLIVATGAHQPIFSSKPAGPVLNHLPLDY